MLRILTAALILGAAAPAMAQHQHHAAPAAASAESLLPAACRTAAAPAGGGHAAMPMDGLNEHQRAAMQGMEQMDRDMMAGMMNDDADMAFICGMIAHHQGAIAMSEVVLRYGDDDQAKALARRIIDAQKAEIAEMTAWVEKQSR